jgi:hypothetical protein
VHTLHKGDKDDDDDNNNIKLLLISRIDFRPSRS